MAEPSRRGGRSDPRSRAREIGVSLGLSIAALTIVLAVLVVAERGPAPGYPTAPYGLALGNPVPGLCPSNTTLAVDACRAGQHDYLVTIEEATSLRMGEVRFAVVSPSDGPTQPLQGGGFALLSMDGTLTASYPVPGNGSSLAMTSEFRVYSGIACSGGPCSSLSPLTTLDSIRVDVGNVAAGGQGLELVASISLGPYAGEHTIVPLP